MQLCIYIGYKYIIYSVIRQHRARFSEMQSHFAALDDRSNIQQVFLMEGPLEPLNTIVL